MDIDDINVKAEGIVLGMDPHFYDQIFFTLMDNHAKYANSIIKPENSFFKIEKRINEIELQNLDECVKIKRAANSWMNRKDPSIEL